MQIRRFIKSDAEAISKLIERDCLEVNIKDYSYDEMVEKAKNFTPDAILKSAIDGNMYVACEEGKILGTATITHYNGKDDEGFLHTVYVLPESHGKGVGRKLIDAIKADGIFINSKRVEVLASITACAFYEKCGFTYKNGIKKLNHEKRYPMEIYTK